MKAYEISHHGTVLQATSSAGEDPLEPAKEYYPAVEETQYRSPIRLVGLFREYALYAYVAHTKILSCK